MPSMLRQSDARPVVVAHRGASADAPENTVPAFARAWADGAPWVECDVQPTGDGEFVLLHDHDVDRTTDGHGPIRSLHRVEWAGLDAGSWCGEAFSGTRIPLLGEFLADLAADVSWTRRVLLEIKGDFTPRQIGDLLDTLAASGVDDRIFLESFEQSALAEVHARQPKRPLGWLVEGWPAEPIARCRELGATMLNPDHRLLRVDVQSVDHLHRAGIALWSWTVDDPADWEFLTRAGVDGIITNRPAELLAWQQGREHARVPEGRRLRSGRAQQP